VHRGEKPIILNLIGWVVHRAEDVALGKIFLRAQVQGDKLWIGSFDRGELGGELALAEDLCLIQPGHINVSLTAGVDEAS